MVTKAWTEIPGYVLDEAESLLENGLVLKAWEKAKPHGDVSCWAPGRARRVAARLAMRTGADRLAYALDWLNWRWNREDPTLYFYGVMARMNWQAPVLLLPEIRARSAALRSGDDDASRGDLLALEAWILGTVRDFSAAGQAMSRALEIDPASPWLLTQHAVLLEMEDRYEESLETARRALLQRPFYRPGILQVVNSLVHLGRDDEAIGLLRDAHEKTEESAFALRLQAFFSEREDHENGLWCLREAEARMPLMDASMRKWLAGRRADFLYQAGDFEGCLEWCDRKGEGFQKRIAEKLRRPEARQRGRRRLDVPFVRQHNMTCAPATLAALAKYWGCDHDHLAIAREICHEGTPWHKERAWAESQGFLVKEFRFTREALVSLIDRGVPFTLTTTAVTSAHLQACIGYDDRCDVVLLRDPTHRHYGEMIIDGLVEAHPLQGPRCLLLLPKEEAARIAGVHLPDEALYEARHHFALALERHDRWRAQEALSTMRAIDPDHPLTQDTEGDLAGYLGHTAKALEIIDRLLARFPEHQPLHLRRLGALKRLGDYQAAQTLLRREVAKVGGDPVFASELGESLLEDARQWPLAGHFLRRALRLRRSEGHPLESYARWLDKRGDFARAAELRRHASTATPAWEPYAKAYFDSCRSCGRIEEGLGFLASRCGEKHSSPWLTHAMALHSIQRSAEAKVVVESALAAFPEDGELKLQAARLMLGWGEAERTIGLGWIEEAKPRVSLSSWLRHAAEAAIVIGDRPRAIRLWREVLRGEPLAMDAYERLPRLLAEELGEREALEFLRQATREHPRHPGLWRMLAQWEKEPGASLPVLDRILELDPDDHWSRRERVIARARSEDRDGAFEDAEQVIERDGGCAESHGALATLLNQFGRRQEALVSLRRALEIRIDYTYAIGRLIEWSDGRAAKAEALAFIEGEMKRQVSNGDCVPEYQACAWNLLPPMELLERLRMYCQERPDLWQTWAARLDQALRMDLREEAAACADHLVRAFPLMPRAWVESAKACRAQGDKAGELAAFEKTMRLSPTWDWAARQYSEALERSGRFQEAEEVLRLAIRHEPLVCMNHGLLADLLLKGGKKQEAYDCLLVAVDMGPYYNWGWSLLARLSRELSAEESFRQRFAAQHASHGHDAAWWLIAAEVHEVFGEPEESLNCVRKGLGVNPAHPELCDNLPVLLARLGRFDEALAACGSAPGQDRPSREIEGRRAWVLMESGDGPSAIREMKALLEREPDYAWGWTQLASWHYARGDWKNLLVAAEQWARFCPDQSTAHGHLGLAAERLEDLPKAKLAYQRAFTLDPTYQFAGRKLLSFQIEAAEFEPAGETLAGLRHFAPGPWVEYDAIHLELARKRDGEALEMGKRFCETVTDAEALSCLNRVFIEHRIGPRWLAQLESQIRDGEAVSPAVMSAWAEMFSGERELKAAARRLRRFKMPEEARNAAWDPLLRAGHRAGGTLFDQWHRKERRRFAADASLWNVVGELLLVRGRHRGAVKWFRGWERREKDLGSHTFVNLSAALDSLRGPAAASPIRREGISRFGRDANTHYLRAAEASFLASSGRVEEAAGLLARVEDPYLSNHYLGLASLGRSVVAAAQGGEKEARLHYQVAMEKLGDSAADASVRSHFMAAERSLARHLPWAKGKRRKLRKEWGGLPFELSRWNNLGVGASIAIACVIFVVGVATLMGFFHFVPLIVCGVLVRAFIKNR